MASSHSVVETGFKKLNNFFAKNVVSFLFQSLYVSIEDENTKCKWCPGFKGSQEGQSQHLKSAKSHIKKREEHVHSEELTDNSSSEWTCSSRFFLCEIQEFDDIHSSVFELKDKMDHKQPMSQAFFGAYSLLLTRQDLLIIE